MGVLRELVAKFSVSFDDAELKNGIAAIGDAVGGLKGLAGALGAGVALSAVREFTTSIADQAIALENQSLQLRTSTDQIQRLQQAATMAGASSEAMTAALTKLSQTSKKPDEALMRIADRVSAIHDPIKRARYGTILLGDSYRDLAPLLEKGRKGIGSLVNEADSLAGVFDKSTIEDARALRAEMGKLKVFWDGLKTQLGSALLPVMRDLTALLVPLAVRFRQLTKNTQIFKTVAFALGGAGIFKAIAAFGGLRKMLMLLTNQFLKVIAPILILEDFLVFMQGGKSAFGEIVDRLFGKGSADKVRAWVTETFNRVKTWLSDTYTEFKPVIEEIIVLAKRMVTEPGVVWQEFTDGMKQMWSDLVGWIKSSWLGLAFASMIGAGVDGSIQFLKNLYQAFTWLFDYVSKRLTETFDGLSKAREILAKIPGLRSLDNKVFGKTFTDSVLGKSAEEKQRDDW
ncbi:MAG TPA: hypothetical protein VM493_02610, partial [Vicinamibacterales bacterium]|nr:hypothetical protein [Vicinamibacterales bacterium]